ncbi:4-alpha-glucanotransferase [bacterium]|nr:4-alpha-glucanotransferase [bacterium]
MKINEVVRITSNSIGRNTSFGRAPKKGKEEQEYTRTIQDALDYLGIQNRALIIHGTSFPAQQGSWDTNVGSPFGADELVEFAKVHGFNAIQLGPNGKLNRGDTSPYTSSVFEKNPLFINAAKLATDEYASILSADDLKEGATKTRKTGKNYAETNFKNADNNIYNLMGIAYDNFVQKLDDGDKNAQRLNREYTRFQKENSAWLDYYAVLDVLGEQYSTDYYPHWNKADQDLIQNVKKGNSKAIARFNEIQDENAQEIEQYKFTQFIIDKQAKADNLSRGDFVYISDLEVGASSFDEIVFKDVFLPDYKIGCKYGGPMNAPQLWGIAVPDPNKLFNHDGSLGPSGQFIKAKLQNALSGAQSIRIDHAMGLVNPYLYKPSTVQYAKKADAKGNMVEYPDREKLSAGYLSELGIDKHNSYQQVLSRIILPTMREMGVNPKDVIWEDLGSDETGVFNQIFRKQLGLPGISGMIWTKGTDAQKKRDNWAYIGCHDNKPGRQLIADGDIDKREGWKSEYLASALRCDPYKAEEREALKKKIESSPKEQWKAKLADLFRSTKHIQVSFMDFFGINKAYNTPGTSGGSNWTLRLNPDFKDTYYKSLENDDWAINMPEVLETAVQAKFDEDVSKNYKPYWETKAQIDPLLNRLNHWSNVLKEKE